MKPENISISQAIIELQDKLYLPKHFFRNLLEEDDWSFIIKLHSLVEAACGSLLLYHLDESGLKTIISRLELSNKINGKLAFIKELGLFGENYRRFVSSLSEWRNNFVHNVQNCNANLSEIVNTMDKNAIKKFALDFSPHETTLQKFTKIKLKLFNEKTLSEIDTNNLIKRAKDDPKFYVWIGAYDFLVHLIEMEGYSDYLRYEKANKYLDSLWEEE